MKDYYKKIDKSFFHYGITIPEEYIQYFTFNSPIVLGSSRKITVLWKKKRISCEIIPRKSKIWKRLPIKMG